TRELPLPADRLRGRARERHHPRGSRAPAQPRSLAERGRRGPAPARGCLPPVQGRGVGASCHGASGQGIDAPALNSRQFLGSVEDEQMHGIIAGGIPGTEMPAWWNEYGGPLTDQQIQAIVAYIRSWQKTAPDRPDWRNPSGMG